MKLIYLFLFLPLAIFAATPNYDVALKKLMEGNERYITQTPERAPDLEEKREETFEKQTPFAIIVGCSDSRVAPEIIFDQTIGDLFVVRVAGNVIGPLELDSIEFSADKLETPLVVILGHQKCGAVSAVLSGVGGEDMESIIPYIQKSVDETKGMSGDPLTNAIKANVVNGIKTLKKSRVISALLKAKKLKIAGAYYELATGKVEILE